MSNPNMEVGGSIVGAITFEDLTSGKALLESTYDSTGPTLKTYYVDGNHATHEWTPTSDQVLVKKFAVKLSALTAGAQSVAEQAAALQGVTVRITVTAKLVADSESRAPGSEGYDTTYNDAIVQAGATAEAIDGMFANDKKTDTVDYTFAQDYAGAQTTIGYIGVRIYGGAIGNTGINAEDDSATHDCDATVSVGMPE